MGGGHQQADRILSAHRGLRVNLVVVQGRAGHREADRITSSNLRLFVN